MSVDPTDATSMNGLTLNPVVGYKVIVVFDDLVCECNQNIIINYFINGRIGIAVSFT